MSNPGSKKPRLREDLIRQGVPQEEIQKMYRSLREKGYGEEEARQKASADLDRLRAQRAMEERRRVAAQPDASRGTTAGPSAGSDAAQAAARRAAEAARGRRAADWVPEVPAWLRREINRYAFRNGYLITGLPERFDDLMSYFDRTRGDFVNRALLRLVAEEKGYRGKNPYQLSFLDNLDALRDTARRLLGVSALAPGAEKAEGDVAAVRALHATEPFAVEFFSVFTLPYDTLRKSLEYLGTALRARRRVPVSDLARVVKDGCRLIVLTDSLERDRLEMLFDAAREVDAARSPGARAAAEFADAEALFRACFQNLRRYSHELYPALLKMIGAFYDAEENSARKRAAILGFLSLREDEIMTWEGWQKRLRELKEKELQERQSRELERLEEEKAESFTVRFEGTLSMLTSLFPESGIERLEKGEFVLPYFVNRIFSRNPLYQSRLADLERISSSDVMGLVLILHTLLDDLLSSLDPIALEKVTGKDGLAAAFASVRDSWRDAYPRLFEPYMDTLREYSKETGGEVRYGELSREGGRARALEERLNQIRNRAIRNFGHLVTAREQFEGPKLFDLAAQLAGLLTDAGQLINQTTLTADDPVSRRTKEDLVEIGIVDLEANSVPGTVDYRPATRQIKRWIEARFREPVGDIPQKAQVGFMDVFRAVSYLYDTMLNDPKSFVARGSHAISLASVEDRDAWTKERTARGRDSFQTLQAALLEQFPGQFVDALTGLRNKDYFLTELPRKLEKLRSRRAAITFLLMDIDHFKWVNDELGHPRGDEVLQYTAAMIMDNIREGDMAIRYGGEEMLIVVPGDLHTGIILAERLRHGQESNVLAREIMADVRTVAETGGQPCGTLSIGVADVSTVRELPKAVEKVDKALYAAKRTRNAVVFIDPAKEKRGGGEAFSRYADYRRQAGATTA